MNNRRGLVIALMLVSVLAVARSAIASTIVAEGLLGSVVSGVSSVTGGTTISPLGSLGPAVPIAAGPEFSFCVGPNGDNCVSSGLFGSVDLSDTGVTFTFFGSTFATNGSFRIALNFATPIIGNVALSSGGIPGFTFGLTSSTPTSMVFTGTPGGGGVYNSIGSSSATFSVQAVPEPGTLILLGLGLVSSSRAIRRRRSAQA